MSFGGFNTQHHAVKAEINVVPLVDVMLVLLVIFIITAPLLTHSVKVDLPRASSNPNITKPDHIELGIKEDGQLFWNGELSQNQPWRNVLPQKLKKHRNLKSTSRPISVLSMIMWRKFYRPRQE